MADNSIIEIQMPQMGESVTEGTILEWHVAEGEEVSEGDTVVEVSTDKIDAEVPAPSSGVITKILASVDDTVTVGQALAELDPNGSGNGAAPSSDGDSATTTATEEETPGSNQEPPGLAVAGTGEGDQDLGGGTSTEEHQAESEAGGQEVVITMPEMGESVTEGTILEWHVAEGDQIAEGDTVVEVSTDKVDAEVPAPADGTITKILVGPDETIEVGKPMAVLTKGDAPSMEASSEPATSDSEAGSAPAPAGASTSLDGDTKATPVARRAAQANGVDLKGVK